MHRHFPATSWLPTAPSCTPNNPPCTPGAPWVDSDRRRWDSAFFGFPPFPPTRTPHPTTPYTLRTLDHRPDSESQPQPLFFHLARKTPRFWYTLKSGPVGGGTRRWHVPSKILARDRLPFRAVVMIVVGMISIGPTPSNRIMPILPSSAGADGGLSW